MSTAIADTVAQDSRTLIRHILDRYHSVHRRELPELIRLARRVERAHRDHPEAPVGLTDLLSQVEYAMEAHMRKEEHGLFPELRAGETHMAVAMELMRDEHDDHARRLDELAALSRQHRPPAGACASWRALCAGTAKFADDLREHIRLENELLFPAFGA